MIRETIKVDKKLYEKIIQENIKLRAELEQYKTREPLTPQIMENQISIDDYIKVLKKGKKKNE